jgi:predicted Mrr-cat superfamily restriction endonuclease
METTLIPTGTETTWAIRAGVGGEAHELFLECGVIALADPGMGDLNRLPQERESFHRAYRQLHPSEPRTSTAGAAGKFFRFVHDVGSGDIILYPSVRDKVIYVGAVAGAYIFQQDAEDAFQHRREVRWLGSISKRQLSESSQRELGAARTFFEVRRAKTEIARLARTRGLTPLGESPQEVDDEA